MLSHAVVWDKTHATACSYDMIELSQLNADRLKNEYWERQLKNFDPHLFIRFDEIKSRWLVFEFYKENRYIKPLFWLEDNEGNPKEFGQWALNKLHVMALTHQEKERKGTNNWFNDLEAEADRQDKELDEKISEENRYMYKHDKMQWRKGIRELFNRPGKDVFAGYQYQPQIKDKGVTYAQLVSSTESTGIQGADSSSVQSNTGKSENPGE